MSLHDAQQRRVLVVEERQHRLEAVTRVVGQLGHEVVVRPMSDVDVGEVIAAEAPDVALVSIGSRLALEFELVSAFVRAGSCPVIGLLATRDHEAIRETSRRGAFAVVLRGDATELHGAIEVAVQRFAEYRGLQEAFARRAVIEQAKGILMARHGTDAETAFGMLREHSQNNGRKLVAVAEGVVRSHQLLGPGVENSARAQH